MKGRNLISYSRPGSVLAALLLLLLSFLNLAGTPSFVSGSENIATWQLLASGTTCQLRAVWGTSSYDVFAVGSGGTILHYDGTSWTTMASGTTNSLCGVWGASSSNVFAVGDNATILHYDGDTWSPMTSNTDSYLNGIWGSSASDVFAVGSGGTILHYDGTAWTAMGSDANLDLNSVCGTSSSDVYAVSSGYLPDFWYTYWTVFMVGQVLHYDGNAWLAQYNCSACQLMGVWANSPSDVIAVGYNYRVVPRYDGQEWSRVPIPDDIFEVQLYGVWGSSPSNVYAVGKERNLHWDGQTWSLWNTGISLYGVWGSSAYDIFAVGDAGTILRSRPPDIELITTTQGTQGQSASISITGTNLGSTSAVSFGDGISVDSFVVDSPSQVTASITISETAEPGPRDVSVNAAGGSATLRYAFVVEPAEPILRLLNITQARRGETLSITIAGIYLTEESSLDFGEGITVEDFTMDSPIQMTCSITIAADAALGHRDVSIVTPGGTCTLSEGFQVVRAGSGTPAWIWICVVVAGGAVVIAAPAVYFLVRRRTSR